MEPKSTSIPDDFSMVSGGLIHTITSGLKSKWGFRGVLLALIGITWLPICVISIYYHTFSDHVPSVSFLDDFQIHVRFLLILPFFVLIESFVDSTFVQFVNTTEKLVLPKDQIKYEKLVRQLNDSTNSFLPEVILLIAIYFLIFLNWDNLSALENHKSYLQFSENNLNLAGYYYLLIASPIFQLFIFRWVWRWIVWAYSIIRISFFKIQTDPFHADRAAGLAYLNMCPLTFSFIMMGVSAVLAAYIGIEVIYKGYDLLSFKFQILLYLVALTTIIYSPLLFLIPTLIKSKIWGLENFGDLLRKHDTDYTQKWILNFPDEKKDPLLGSVDNSSLADINGSYDPIAGIRIYLIDVRMMIVSIGLNAVVFIPLAFTHYTTRELFSTLINELVG